MSQLVISTRPPRPKPLWSCAVRLRLARRRSSTAKIDSAGYSTRTTRHKNKQERQQARVEMKFRVVCRKLYDYVRYDLKEIAFPSSLPDPPHIKKRPKLTWHDRWCIFKEATRLYGASWVRDIGPDLRPNDYKKAAEDDEEETSNGRPGTDNGKKGKSSEPSVLEDLAVAARGGAETLKPALRRIYMSRASTYTDAMKNFVETYQEGLKDQLQEKAADGDGSSKQTQQGDEATMKPPPPPPSSS